MVKYAYKGFDVCYEIKSPHYQNETDNLYTAEGFATCSLPSEDSPQPQKFYTESFSEREAKAEIQKLLEEYIDFEWKKYHEMSNE